MQTHFFRERVSHSTGWRIQAAAIVEEILPHAKSTQVDILLDLRSMLLDEVTWENLLDTFLQARAVVEDDHYMPFFRLRQLLEYSLRLEMAIQPDTPHSDMIRDMLRRKFPTLASYRRELKRLEFELNVTDDILSQKIQT